MANLYRQYMRLLKKWPLDESKVTDLGQHIRDQVKIAFAKGENSKIDNRVTCQRNIESLERLAANHFFKQYPYDVKKTATGMAPEVCRQALSKEFSEYLQEQKLSRFAKFKQRLKNTYVKYSEKQ